MATEVQRGPAGALFLARGSEMSPSANLSANFASWGHFAQEPFATATISFEKGTQQQLELSRAFLAESEISSNYRDIGSDLGLK